MNSLQLIIILLFVDLIYANFYLNRLTLTNKISTFTITFPSTFVKIPVFTYYTQTALIYSSTFQITHDNNQTYATKTQLTIMSIVEKSNNFLVNELIKIVILLTDESSDYFQIGWVDFELVNSSALLSISPLANSNYTFYQFYALTFPVVWTKSLNISNCLLTFTQYSSKFIIFHFSFIFVSTEFLSNNIITINQQISTYKLDWLFYNQNHLFNASLNNIFFAIKNYSSNSVPFINNTVIMLFNIQSGIIYNQNQFGYLFNSNPTQFNADIILFNSSFSGCGESKYLYYPTYFTSLPSSCIACSLLCATCTSINYSQPQKTDQYHCLSCKQYYVLNLTSPTSTTGNCICNPGLSVINGICEPCQVDCLTFDVVYLETNSKVVFILTYSYFNVKEDVDLEQNLQVTINNFPVNFTVYLQLNSVYAIYLQLVDAAICQLSSCEVNFLIKHPQSVKRQIYPFRALSNTNITVILQNFVNYYSLLPSQLKAGFYVVSMIVGASFTGGYTSLVRILFQLEQIIEYHRYLNVSIPVVFDSFLETLMPFKFLDFSNIAPLSIQLAIKNISVNNVDIYGGPKMLYYDNGANFYKNIIWTLISLMSVLFINLALYFIFSIIPCKLINKLATKIKVRKLITLHDNIEQLSLPIIFFSIAQFSNIIIIPELIWVYGLTFLVAFIPLFTPFFMVIYIYSNRHLKNEIPIFEDLLQDNTMGQKFTYFYYIFCYYRKIIFALFITYGIPGIIQLYLVLALNILYFTFTVYLIIANTYLSKIKIVIKILNSVTIISVEILILFYNINDYSPETMVQIGIACLYLALITTVMCIIQIFVKIFDTILQQINKNYYESAANQYFETSKNRILKQFTKNTILCNIGKQYIGSKISASLDQKQQKFIQDKQLMQNTFCYKDEEKSNESDVLPSSFNSTDLVYIDEDECNQQELKDVQNKHRNNQIDKIDLKIRDNPDDLYQISSDIDSNFKQLEQKQARKKRFTKYDADDDHIIVAQSHHNQKSRKKNPYSIILHIKPTAKMQENISQLQNESSNQ